jgi:hypothetical protein
MSYQFMPAKIAVAVTVLTCFTIGVHAQQQFPPHADIILSEPVHTTFYPEIMCVGCVVPKWDRSYLLHQEFDRDPAVVTMYDAKGDKVLTGRISMPKLSDVWAISVAATHDNGILAGAAGAMTDGTRKGFIARTDRTGRTLESVPTANFEPDRVCEGADGTVWTLGPSWDEDKNVLRHYSFEKGLLGTFVSLHSKRDAVLEVASGGESYLYCGSERVSVYLALSGQYIEVNTSTNKLSSWTIDLSSVIGEESRGFAVTDDHRIFVAFGELYRIHGLYELRAESGKPTASLTPVDVTIASQDTNNGAPEGVISHLFGADGNELVVQRNGDGPGLSWVKVVSSVETPD